MLGSVLQSVLRAYWERTVKQAGSVPSSAIESVLRADLGAYSQAGWECAIECNLERLESLLGSVSQAGWVCIIECNQECTSECIWERAMKCIWQFC